MALHNEIGKWGEQVAAEYLESKGWYIRHRDWKDVHRDLDIVAIDADSSILLIVEVKTRSTEAFGEPDEAITLQKKTNIIRATTRYINTYRLHNLEIRYDTISIVGTPTSPQPPTIVHKEGAFDVVARYHFYEQQRKSAAYRKKHHPGTWGSNNWRSR